MAEAVPRSDAGNHAATIRALPGKDGASARPTMKRMAKKVATAGRKAIRPTKPWVRVKKDQITMALM